MGRRSYNQNCVLARTSDVIGERWTVLLLRDLLISPRRYSDLLLSLKGIGTNLLASRLKDLQDSGLIEQREGDDGTSRYALTESGRALEPALLALIRWGMIHGPENRPRDHHRHDWDLLALKALFRDDLADDLSIIVQFRSGDFEGWVLIEDRDIQIGTGQNPNAQITINGTVGDLFLGRKSLRELIAEGGDAASLDRFVSAFAG